MENKQPGMANPFPHKKSSWFSRPWNILGLILVAIATTFIAMSYMSPEVVGTMYTCNTIEGVGFKFDSIWLLFVVGALFMDTPLRGLVSKIRNNNTQSSQAPDTQATQQRPNKDA